MSSFKFTAELTDFKMVYNVLKATSLKEFAVFHPMEEGLKVTVDDTTAVEASVYIPADLFDSYYIDSAEDIKFKISLKVFTECLHIYGDETSPSLKISYKDSHSPLYLVIVHSDEHITVDCEIQTMDMDNFSDVSLSDECNANKIIIAADTLVDVLDDIDQSSDEMQLTISPEEPFFSLKANSGRGETVVSISKFSEAVTVFHCTETVKFSYVFHHIRQIIKAMNVANKVSISTNDNGLLGMQLVINTNEKQIFVEYYVTALFF